MPIVDAIANDRPGIFSVNVPNRGAIEGIADDVVVEGKALVDRGGVQLLQVGRLPEKLMLLVLRPRVLKAEQELAAYLTGDRAVLEHLVLEDHRTDSLEQAQALVDLMLSQPPAAEVAERLGPRQAPLPAYDLTAAAVRGGSIRHGAGQDIAATRRLWTGSSRRDGRVIAGHLAGLGAVVAVHGTTPTSSRSFDEAESLQAVADAIAAEHGAEVVTAHGDLTVPENAERIVGEVRARLGRIDILVNNAGGNIGAAGLGGPDGWEPKPDDAVFVSLADTETVLARNLMSCIYMCRQVAPEMIERKSGSVNFASVNGLLGVPNKVMYSVAKVVVEYTRCLAVQLAPYDVNVNVVAPGPDRDAAHPGRAADRRGDAGRERDAGAGRLAQGGRPDRRVPRLRRVLLRDRPGDPGRRRPSGVSGLTAWTDASRRRRSARRRGATPTLCCSRGHGAGCSPTD